MKEISKKGLCPTSKSSLASFKRVILTQKNRYRIGVVFCTALLSPPNYADEFTAISAGDMTSTGAILWTQWSNAANSISGTVQVSTDNSFASSVDSGFSTVVNNGNTSKVALTGLLADTQYFYRFSSGATTSAVGSFFTTPASTTIEKYKIAFTGDYDAKWRPYSVLANFGNASLNPGSSHINAFINLGDLMYEKSATGSPAVDSLTPSSTVTQIDAAKAGYYRKYLEGISGVDTSGNISATGNQGMKGMLASVGVYSLIDNHELNGALISGGASQTAAKENLDLSQAINTSGSYVNQTNSFLMMSKAFFDNHASAVQINGDPGSYALTNLQLANPSVSAPTDPRSNGTVQNYFSRSWGGAATYIQLDDRSYRDARMGNDDVSLAAQVANMPGRTMLGSTQLDWFKSQLLAAKEAGVWAVISVSTPIDQWDPNDNKSWLAGYNSERNNLLKFIADNKIDHAVFLTTDDHMDRATQLRYQPDPIHNPNNWVDVPGVFQVLTGPAGAVGPYENMTDPAFGATDASITRSQQVLQKQIDTKQANTNAMGLGLMGMSGLSNVYRKGDPSATTNPTAIDFFSATSFTYSTLEWDRFANLRVKYWGIDAYAPNSYPSTTPTPELVNSFDVDVPYTITQVASRVSLTDSDFTDTDLLHVGMAINRQFKSAWTVNGQLNLSGLGGDVTFSSVSGASSGVIALGNHTLIITNGSGAFNGTIQNCFEGDISCSGPGSLELKSGQFQLGGTNTYTGSTTVQAGGNLLLASSNALGSGQLNLIGSSSTPAILTTLEDMTIGNNIIVEGDPTFVVAPGTTTTITGIVSDGSTAGDVVVDGGGLLSFTNANTYRGLTQINSGSSLALVGSGSVANSNTIINNGVLDIAQANGNVSFGGSFSQSNSGTFIMKGQNQLVTIAGNTNLSGALNLVGLAPGYQLGQHVSLFSLNSSLPNSVNFNSVSTNLGSASWVTLTPSGLDWVYGPSPYSTLNSIEQNTPGLATSFNQQLGALQAALTYDCVKFDSNNICLSGGGRYTYAGANPSGDAQAALVILGYKPAPSIRVGVYLDQSINISSPSNISQTHDSPMWGLFGNWSQHQDGTGLSLEGNAAFAFSSLAVSRSSNYSTEPGSGSGSFNSQAFRLQANYALPITEEIRLIPYLGIRYTHLNFGSYSESSNSQVMAPLSYNSLTQSIFSALSGVGLYSKLAEKLSGVVSVGFQQNLMYSMSNYSGTSTIPGINSFSVQMPSYQNTMITTSAGLFYDVVSNQRVGLNFLWQQQPFIGTNTSSVMATYTIGF